MPPLSPFPSPPEPLPRAPGPKLAPFTPTAHAEIEFIQQLGDPEVNKDGHVWKVRINGAEHLYALKMFPFISSVHLKRTAASGLRRSLASPQLYVDFFDPFNRECRAYGRLKEEGRLNLVVPAHGYLLLTRQQEIEITSKITGGDNADLWNREEENDLLPLRAIVKELATDTNAFTAEQVPCLWNDLQEFHKMGILVRDPTVENYRDGKLIEFSRSWTMPHPALMDLHPEELDEELGREPLTLRTSIVEFSIGEGWKWDKLNVPEDLENCVDGKGEPDKYGIDPRKYDWKKWESNRSMADALLARKLFRSKRRARQ